MSDEQCRSGWHHTRRRFLGAIGTTVAGSAAGGAGVASGTRESEPALLDRAGEQRARIAQADAQRWAQLGADRANTGYNPGASGPGNDAGVAWEFSTGFPSIHGLAPGDGLVYAGHDHGVAAIDPADGTIEWEKSTDDVVETPGVAASVVAVQGGPAGILGLDPETGEEQWAFETESFRGTNGQTASGDTVYLGDYDGYVYAIDAADGTELWRSSVDDELGPPPAVANGTVYVLSETGNAYAFDATDGTERWSATPDEDVFAGRPSVIDGTVVARSDEGVVGFDVGDGSRNWSTEIPTTFATAATATAAEGRLYVPSRSGLVVLDPADGSIHWQTDLTLDLLTPAVVDGTVYAAGDGNYAFAFDAASGDRQWRVELTDDARTGVVAVDGTIFVGCDNGNRATTREQRSQALYAFDPANGDSEWSLDAGGRITAAPVVADGTVCVGTWGEALYGIAADEGSQEWRFKDLEALSSGRIDTAATIVDGTAYVCTSPRRLLGLDLASGEIDFTAETEDEIPGFRASPIVANGRVHASTSVGVATFDASTGEPVWRSEVDGEVVGTPALIDGTLYVATAGATWHAIDAASGDRQWTFDRPGNCHDSPVVADGTALFLTTDALYAVDAATGGERWSDELPDGTLCRPSVAGGSVYLPVGDVVHSFDLGDGSVRYSVEIEKNLDTAFSIADGTLYAGAGDGVVAVDADSGEARWHVELGDVVSSAPAVVDGVVYAGSSDTSLYAISADGGSGSGAGFGSGGGGGGSNALPGPGIVGGLTGLAGAAYALKRRLADEE